MIVNLNKFKWKVKKVCNFSGGGGSWSLELNLKSSDVIPSFMNHVFITCTSIGIMIILAVKKKKPCSKS